MGHYYLPPERPEDLEELLRPEEFVLLLREGDS